MAFGGENIDRTGEIRENNKGTLMKIISYRTCSDVQVEFLDGHHYITNTTYLNFKRGQVGNPSSRSGSW